MVLVLLGKKYKQGSTEISGPKPLVFLIYINDLPHEISSISKMFADDNSLFSKVKDSSLSLSLILTMTWKQ